MLHIAYRAPGDDAAVVHVDAERLDRAGVEGGRIRLTKKDAVGAHAGLQHYIDEGFVAGVEGDKVRLSANADIAVTLEEEKSGRPV